MVDLSHIKLYYFYFVKYKDVYIGRGENIKLLLEDAGIPHEYIKFKWDDWPKMRNDWIEKDGYLSGALPAIETADGKRYGGTVPVLRFLSKLLNKYYGSNVEEEHLVDMASDLAVDWYFDFDPSVWTDDPKARENYLEKTLPKHLERMNRFYAASGGPYILGTEISFADFQVYHMIVDEKLKKEQLPSHLAAFVEAFEERPNIKKYLQEKASQ